MLLRCRGCGCTATADQISANELSEMLGWRRAPNGDWCFLCQWNDGHTPRVIARLYLDAERGCVARRFEQRDKTDSIWATIRLYG